MRKYSMWWVGGQQKAYFSPQNVYRRVGTWSKISGTCTYM